MRVPLLFLLATIALGAALASCGSDEEVAPVMTPAATTLAPTIPGTPSPSPVPIPADWPTYTDPGGRLTVRYPSNWFARENNLFSFDPDAGPGLPPEAVAVEFGYYLAKGSTGCGSLSVDPATGEGTPRGGATPTTLGGIEAWESIGEAGDGSFEGNFTRIHGVAAIHNGYCFYVAAYFTQRKPDSATFLQIVASYRFVDVVP